MKDHSRFEEVVNEHCDNNGVEFIDGYFTGRDEGIVIATVVFGEVYYRDPEDQFDPLVAEMVKEVVESQQISDELVNRVVEQIKSDIYSKDVTAITELIKFVPKQFLEGYLPE